MWPIVSPVSIVVVLGSEVAVYISFGVGEGSLRSVDVIEYPVILTPPLSLGVFHLRVRSANVDDVGDIKDIFTSSGGDG